MSGSLPGSIGRASAVLTWRQMLPMQRSGPAHRGIHRTPDSWGTGLAACVAYA